MKKLTVVFALLLIFSTLFSQEAIKFTMGLLPKKSYDQTLVQKTKIEFSLDSATNKNYQSHSNVSKPPLMGEQGVRITSIIHTGVINKQTGKMPVTMTIIDVDSNAIKFLNPGTLFIGNAGLNEIPVYDSVSGINLDANHKLLMLKVLSNLSKISLPSASLKPGQYDTVNTSLNNPMGGTEKMDFITTYHLKSIQGSTAFFDIKVDIHLNIVKKDKSIPGVGTGEGLMEYDLQNHYPSLYNLSYQIKVTQTKDGRNTDMKMTTNMLNTCKVHAL